MTGTAAARNTDRRHRSQASRNRRKGYCTAVLLITCVVFTLCAVLLIHGLRIKSSIERDAVTVESLKGELAMERARTGQIEATKERIHSDEFVRDAAENRLGLVPADGYVLREKTE